MSKKAIFFGILGLAPKIPKNIAFLLVLQEIVLQERRLLVLQEIVLKERRLQAIRKSFIFILQICRSFF